MQVSVSYRSYAGFVVSGLLVALCGEQAFAAGFAVRAQSASSIGTAGASDVAGTADISAMFSNPAALSAFKGQNVSVGGAYVMPNAKFSNGKRTVGSTGVDAMTEEAGSDTSDDFSDSSFIPALYGTYEVNEDIVAGLALTAPFGTATDYGKDWVGRYHGTKTELEVINLDLAASYKVMDNLKLGFGIQVQSASGLIEGASNYGAAAYKASADLVGSYYTAALAGNSSAAATAAAAIAANPIAAAMKSAADAAIAGQPAAARPGIIGTVLNTAVLSNEGKDDVYAEYKGSDIGYGFTFGVLYTPIPELDLGFSYRSQVVHKTEGDFKLSAESALSQAYVDSKGNQKAKLNLPVPDIIGFGAAYKGIESVQLYANASLTRWSKLRDFNVRPDDGNDVQVMLDWEDVWYVGIGGAYKSMPTPSASALRATTRRPPMICVRRGVRMTTANSLLSAAVTMAKAGASMPASYTRSSVIRLCS